MNFKWRHQCGRVSVCSWWSVDIAFAVRMWVAVGSLLNVCHAFIVVWQWHRLLLVDLPLHVGFQHGPLIVGEGHGEQGLGVAHKLIDVSLTCHLKSQKKRDAISLTSGCCWTWTWTYFTSFVIDFCRKGNTYYITHNTFFHYALALSHPLPSAWSLFHSSSVTSGWVCRSSWQGDSFGSPSVVPPSE